MILAILIIIVSLFCMVLFTIGFLGLFFSNEKSFSVALILIALFGLLIVYVCSSIPSSYEVPKGYTEECVEYDVVENFNKNCSYGVLNSSSPCIPDIDFCYDIDDSKHPLGILYLHSCPDGEEMMVNVSTCVKYNLVRSVV